MIKSGIDLKNRIKYEKFYSIKDKDTWLRISMTPGLTEDFISVFRDKVFWTSISMYQYLSEDFIYKFANRLDIIMVRFYQGEHLSSKCLDWLQHFDIEQAGNKNEID